jgi:hypothetical protein
MRAASVKPVRCASCGVSGFYTLNKESTLLPNYNPA